MANSWHFSGFATAAGIIVNTSELQSGGGFGGQARRFKMHGFSVSGSTAVAISTENIKLRYGVSSDAGAFTTIVLCKAPGNTMIGVSGLEGIEFGYAEIRSTVAAADGGRVAMIWGA